jgi:hypothetical protein
MNAFRRVVFPAWGGLLAAFLFLCFSCEKEKADRPPAVAATLVEEKGRLYLVLRNIADTALVICTRNFYDPIQCLDIKRMSDTTEYSTAVLIGGAHAVARRTIITRDEFVSLDTARELRLRVDMRYVRRDAGAGRPVLVRVYFKNIDPFNCSRVNIGSHDKATQNYCRLMHYVPSGTHNYWVGEVRTDYLAVKLGRYVKRYRKAAKKRSREVVVRRSRTHPLKKKVF